MSTHNIHFHDKIIIIRKLPKISLKNSLRTQKKNKKKPQKTTTKKRVRISHGKRAIGL